MSSTLHSGQAHCTLSSLADRPGLEDVIPRTEALSRSLCVLQLGWERPLWGRCTPPDSLLPRPQKKRKKQQESDPWPARAVGIISSYSKSSRVLAATVVIDLCYSECFLLLPLVDFKSNIYQKKEERESSLKAGCLAS